MLGGARADDRLTQAIEGTLLRGLHAIVDKDECLLAAVEALIAPTLEIIERAESAPTGEERMRQAVVAFLDLVAEQPAAAKLCFIEIYAAGPKGEAEIDERSTSSRSSASASSTRFPVARECRHRWCAR
jgi:hypothetical protein